SRKAVKTAAETFVANPALDVAETIGKLGVGEALVSTLQAKGNPMPVEHTLVAPSRCRMGAITEAERMQVRAGSPVGAKYDKAVNRESPAEMLAKKAAAAAAGSCSPAPKPTGNGSDGDGDGIGARIGEWMWGTKRRQGAVETMAKQAARTVGSQIGRRILRGVLGGFTGGRK